MNRELIIKLENASSKMKELLPNDDSQFLIDCHNEVMSVIRETQQALTQPIITNEQVRESIEYFKNRNSFEIPVYDTPQFNNIAQYIAQLEELNKGHQETIELLAQERDTAFDKLDKIEEIVVTKTPSCVADREPLILSILKENPND